MSEGADRNSVVPTPVETGNMQPAATEQQPVDDSPSSARRNEKTDSASRSRFLRPRAGLIIALVGLCTLLAFEVVFIAKGTAPNQARTQPTAGVPTTETDADAGVDFGLSKVAANPSPTSTETQTPATPEFTEEGVDDQPKRTRPKHYATVHEAAIGSCTTSSVDGLSRQIIEQVRCTDPTAFVPIPARSNLVLEPQTLAYLELSARDHLLKALDKNRDKTLTVHSALRTVAQQYMVWRWSASRRCGVQMATAPGESNHETGRALDIGGQAQWRSALEAQDFRWLGAADAVHFDFKSNRALSRAPDILAFQRLWNRNHAEDRIAESGQYDAATEQRLKKSPPSGFRVGPTCARPRVTATSKSKGAKSARR